MKELYQNQEWLVEQYLVRRRRAEDIGAECGVSRHTVFGWAKKFGLVRQRIDPLRSSSRYPILADFFERIDEERKAYWLGFLAADGCVDNRKGRHFLQVELSSRDRSHLEALKNTLGYGGPIYYDRDRDSFGKTSKCDLLKIGCKQMVCDLVRHGISPQKTKTLLPPQIEPVLVRHWIRGYFDGDGSVSLVSTTGQICGGFFGTEQVTRFIACQLQEQSDCEINAYARPQKGGWELNFNGNGVSRRIATYLYEDASIWLKRKRRKFERDKE